MSNTIQQAAIQVTATSDIEERRDRLADLRAAIEHGAHLLPAQGPITTFIHHNTLHAFEDLPFTEAVRQGARTFGCQPFLAEERYREQLAAGRIRVEDLTTALMDDMGDRSEGLIGFLGTRFHLRLAMLQYPLRVAPDVELRWLVAETDALHRYRTDVPAAQRHRVLEETRHWVMRDLRHAQRQETTAHDRRIHNAVGGLFERFGRSSIESWSDATWESFSLHMLWRACHNGVHGIPSFTKLPPTPLRHRDVMLEASGEDSDRLVREVLIPFCAAFLDQGLADWFLPGRDQGFYRSFLSLYGLAGWWQAEPMRGMGRELARLRSAGGGPLESIGESLELLGVGAAEQEAFLMATLLGLRGWAGMLWQMETRADRAVRPAPAGSLVEFLAVWLILERLALAHVAREAMHFDGPLHELRRTIGANTPRPEGPSVDQRAFLVFQLAQVLGWKPQDLYHLSKQEWSLLLREIETFNSLERRRIFHLAFEGRYRMQALDALISHDRRRTRTDHKPTFQVVCCIDDREESFRRHLEEQAPECETFSLAGFFGVAMYYQGAADAHFVPLCPIIMRPNHYVREDAVVTFEESHRRRVWARRLLGTATHRVHVGSRTLLGGVLTAVLGSVASIPLVARVLFPRLTAQVRRVIGRLVGPPPVTQLCLERAADDPGPEEGRLGYTVAEMADIVERQLRDAGLTTNLARLVIFIGHGSSSLNNPHESAYNCGACAGSRGGPNARAFARMANDPRVRALLAARGLMLPSEVVFLGAFHNTCDDSVTYFALERLPPTHRADFAAAKEGIDRAREWNAHERCRRFESAPLNLSSEAALRHVEGRAEDLAQTRPEYNHATNAALIVGRRCRTRGLFLDRRAFLNSYDPTQDDEDGTILTRILQAAVPVCAGISLEYYFSCVDPAGWGCGTKLPHNVTSMLGVMDGAASDLRPGLSTQMIEIHEPLRLLCVIETTPAIMQKIMDRNPLIGRLCRNGWVQLAVLDPGSPTIHVYRDGIFQLHRTECTALAELDASIDWYRGWRKNLGFARVRDRSPAMHYQDGIMAERREQP